MPRTKNVFTDNDEIARLWINQTQDYATNRSRNLYFRGPTIYSYGTHFPIASFVQKGKKPPVILFTARGYSVTTRQHKWTVSSAINRSDYDCFNVEDVYGHTDYNISSYNSRMRLQAEAIEKRRVFGYLNIESLRRIRDEALAYCKYFRLSKKLVVVPAGFHEERLVRLEAGFREARPKHDEMVERRQEARRAAWEAVRRASEEAANLSRDSWLEGSTYLPTSQVFAWPYNGPVRLRRKPGWIESSMGERLDQVELAVTLSAARSGFRFSGVKNMSIGRHVLVGITDQAFALGASDRLLEFQEIERVLATPEPPPGPPVTDEVTFTIPEHFPGTTFTINGIAINPTSPPPQPPKPIHTHRMTQRLVVTGKEQP